MASVNQAGRRSSTSAMRWRGSRGATSGRRWCWRIRRSVASLRDELRKQVDEPKAARTPVTVAYLLDEWAVAHGGENRSGRDGTGSGEPSAVVGAAIADTSAAYA